MLNVNVKLFQTVSIRQENGSIKVYDLDHVILVNRRVETLGDAESQVAYCLRKYAATANERIEAKITLPSDGHPRLFAQATPMADWQTMDEEDRDEPVQWNWQVRWPLDQCTVATR